MTPHSDLEGRRQHVLLLVLFLLCVLVYLRGLFGGFVFDDFGSIVQNPALRALDGSGFRWFTLALSSDAGLLRRPLSMLSFGLDYSLFGLNPLAFKITNLAIHLANGALLYSLALRLVPRLVGTHADARFALSTSRIALLASALWLLHPLNVGNVVYIVQRMNLLAALFTLAGLVCYAEGRERMLRGERGLPMALGGLCVFGLLAVFSKENGALIVGYALVVEAVAYRFAAPATQQRRVIQAFFWLSVALPIALLAAYLATHPQWLAKGYAGRDFTLYQRVLSEARILCDYLLWIFVPLPRWMGMYHDDFVRSTSIFSPLSTALAIGFLLALVGAAWRLRSRSPAFAFGVAWFLIGQSMESTILPLELIFDHRNYLPMAGLLLGATCAVAPALAARFNVRALVLASGAIVAIFGGLAMTRAIAWSSELRLAMSEVAHHPDSARAQYEAGRQIIFTGTVAGHREKAEKDAVVYFERAKALDPTDLFGASSLLIIRGRNREPIPTETVTDLARRVKTILLPQVNPFLVVLSAATEGSITLAPAQMSLLVTSALDNKVFPPTMRAMILNDYGHYQFQVVHDNQNAVSLTLAAAAEDPQNPLFQINLTKLALALGQTDQAAEHLKIAISLNKVGIYDEAIKNLKQQMQPAAQAGTEG